ncbi:hypothetical protein [Xenorhabdus entomophaga]|uniref:DUF7823 domain-containing protein n=1 Tax=Xenorhabdus entomophaga TaxID=3136257 RepID=UPI0030F40F3F
MSEVNALDNCIFSFDLEVGTGEFRYPQGAQVLGYLADEKFVSNGVYPFGVLTNLQNKTDITEFLFFTWCNANKAISIKVSSGNNQDGYQKMNKFFEKSLTVTVNDEVYFLGSKIIVSNNVGTDNTVENFIGMEKYEYGCQYRYFDARKLGTLLQQNVNKTLHFCLNWE